MLWKLRIIFLLIFQVTLVFALSSFAVAVAPSYSLNSTSTTAVNASISHNLFWNAGASTLSGYVFSWRNGTDWTLSNLSSNLVTGTFNESGTITSTTTSTGFVLPSANTAVSGGWLTPANLYGAGIASDNTTGNTHQWYSFSMGVPVDDGGVKNKTYINSMAVESNCSASTNANTQSVDFNFSNDGGATWSTTGYSTGDMDTTYTIRTSSYGVWGLTWNCTTANAVRLMLRGITSASTRAVRCDFAKINISYTLNQSNTDYNGSIINLSFLAGTLYYTVNNATVIVQISAYNSSVSLSNSNTEPYLNVKAWNGSTWVLIGNVTPTTSGNYSLEVTEATVKSAWGGSSSRNISFQVMMLDSNVTNRDFLNYTGAWVEINSSQAYLNDSWASFGGTTNWSNVTKGVSASVGANISWCVYANNSLNEWNSTSCLSPFWYLTTPSSCICPGTNTNWVFDLYEKCIVQTGCDIGAGNISFTGAGYIRFNASINSTRISDPGSNGIIYVHTNCTLKIKQ